MRSGAQKFILIRLMSSISDIQTAAAKSEPNLASFDAIDINQVTSVTELIALSQIYQYAAEHAAITGESSTVDVVGRCTARVCAIAARLCDVYGARQDVDSCIRALEHLRSIEYGYGLDDISSFVDKQIEILERNAALEPSHRLMLALIGGADDATVAHLVTVTATRPLGFQAVRSFLTAASVVPDVQVPLDAVSLWLDSKIESLGIEVMSRFEKLVDIAPLVWMHIPSRRASIEKLSMADPVPRHCLVQAALQSFISLNTLIAVLAAA